MPTFLHIYFPYVPGPVGDTANDLKLSLEQTRFAWRVNRNRVMDLVWDVGSGYVVRTALRQHPAGLADFEKRLVGRKP